jgi:ABC-type antimicrobial peptide transport system permease subunit
VASLPRSLLLAAPRAATKHVHRQITEHRWSKTIHQSLGLRSNWQNRTEFSIPVPLVVLYVALAAIAGILAAIGPGWSAARVDVLKAVVTE